MTYRSLVHSIGNTHIFFHFRMICLTIPKSQYLSVTCDVPHTEIWSSRKIPNFQDEFQKPLLTLNLQNSMQSVGPACLLSTAI